VFRVIWKSRRLGKISWLSLFAIIFVLIEFVTFSIAQKIYWLFMGIRNRLYEFGVLATLLLHKALIQTIVEESKTTKFTEEFKEIKHYRNYWRFVTAVFGILYILKRLFFIYIALQLDAGTAFIIRTLLGWPLYRYNSFCMLLPT
jgi:hypothetical protein